MKFNHVKNETIEKELVKSLGKRSSMAYPRLVKVVINMGVGEAIRDKKVLEHAVSDLTKIAGQKPIITMTRRSEAGFKIREGWPIGCKVTLRRQRMVDFVESLVSIVLPKIRDFNGINFKCLDGQGNLNFGIKEQIVFDQIKYDTIDKLRGMNITIVTTAKNNHDAYALLKAIGFPMIGYKEKETV